MRKRSIGFVVAAAVAATATIPITPPARADSLPDAFTQIVNHQIPILPDGASSAMIGSFDLGRYYAGPNGLELRFTSAGTSIVLTTILGMENVAAGTTISGSISTVGNVLLQSIPSAGIRNAFKLIDTVVSPTASYIINKLVLGNLCLGVTVPTAGLSTTLDRATALIGAQYVRAFQGPYYSDIKVWFEQCPSSPVLSDTWAAVALPGVPDVVAPAAFQPPSGNPIGFLDDASLTTDQTRISVRGWAIDPDTTSPITVSTYIDGAFVGSTTASTYRPDVGTAYPGFGNNHGYYAEYYAGVGSHQVCTYAINTGPGDTNPQLPSCRTVLISKPSSSVAEHAGSLHDFARGINSEIYDDVWNGTAWSGFQRLNPGAVFEGNPVAVDFSGQLYLFARGVDHQLYLDVLGASGWSGFQQLAPGATFASDPVAVQYGSALGVFARGVDNQLYDDSLNAGTWSGFFPFAPGAVFQGNPAAISFGGGLHVFARGIDNQLYKNTWNGTSWSGFSSLGSGSVFEGDPAVAHFGSSLGVFARSVNHEIYNDSWDGTSWSGFVRMNPGAVFEADPSVATFNSGLHVFARGTDHQVYRNTWNGTSWSGFTLVQNGAVFAGGPNAVQFGAALGVFGRGTDSQMYDDSWDGSNWTGFGVLNPGAVFSGP